MPDGYEIAHAVPVDPAEVVARFTINDGHYAKSKNRVKTAMFSPPSHLRLSVFRVEGLTDTTTAELGQAEFGDKLTVPKKVLAWAILTADKVTAHGLNFVPGSAAQPPKPAHLRHADVVGWPAIEGGDLARSKRLEIAGLLAEASTLHLV